MEITVIRGAPAMQTADDWKVLIIIMIGGSVTRPSNCGVEVSGCELLTDHRQ